MILLRCEKVFDVCDSVTNGGDLFRIFFRELDAEGVLKFHDQFDGVQFFRAEHGAAS